MSRKIRKPTASRVSRSAKRSLRPARRSVSSNRTSRRAVKRRNIARRPSAARRVRPSVRPAAKPRRVMPKKAVRAGVNRVNARPARRSVRATARPAARPTASRRPATRRPATRRPAARPRPAAKPRPAARPRGSRPATPRRPATRPAARRPATPRRPPSRGVGAAIGAAALGAAAFTLNTTRAHPQIATEVGSLQSSLTDLHTRSSFDELEADIQRLDRDLGHAMDLLESAREKGYKYQSDLDQMAFDAAGEWEQAREQALAEIDTQTTAFQSNLHPIGSQVTRLNGRLGTTGASSLVRSTQTQVNTLLNNVSGIERNIENTYSSVQSAVSQLNARLTRIHWVLSQLEEAKFQSGDGEDIVMAVKNRWDQKGDDDPEGLLFLTNKRLIFERKEQVATKKVLFITTAKELVHEVMLDAAVADLGNVKAASKGLFGHQDFLEVGFPGQGSLSMHLDGQDSKDWATLINRVKTGAIEDERATEGGLSYSDLTGNLTQADIVAIQTEVNDLMDDMMLKTVRGELEELETAVGGLERQLGDVRARGYHIESDLEGDIGVLKTQWDRVKGNAEKTVDTQAGLLTTQMQDIQSKMQRLAGMSGNLGAARPTFMQLKSAIASAEAQSEAAEDTVLDQFDEYAAEIEGLAAHLSWVDWMLDALATASFQLLATESGVAAVEATYAAPGMEEENGILFLTDQRILWEDRVGDYELKVDVPLAQVVDVKKELGEDDDGLDEFLVCGFDSNAAMDGAKFDLATFVADDWLKMVGRARNGDYVTDRAVEIDEAELEKVKNAPTSCPNCSASFTSPVLRGQQEITCEYCGAVTRL